MPGGPCTARARDGARRHRHRLERLRVERDRRDRRAAAALGGAELRDGAGRGLRRGERDRSRPSRVPPPAPGAAGRPRRTPRPRRRRTRSSPGSSRPSSRRSSRCTRRRSPGSPTARPARRRTGSPPAPRQRRRCSPRARTTAASARSRPCTARRRGSTGRRRRRSRLDPAPWVGNVRPFVVPSVEMLRTRPPHPLTSRAYARELNEIKDVGALHSTTRTPDQTSAAIFWQDHAFALWNRTFRTLADQPAPGHRRQRAAVRDREPGRRRRRDRLLEQQVPLEHVAPDHGDPRGRDRREPGHRRPIRPGRRCSIRPRRSPRRRRSSPRRSRSTPQATTAPPARSWARSGTSSTPTASRSARPATRTRTTRSWRQPLRGTAGEHQRARVGRDPLPAGRPRRRRARQEGRALPPQPRPPAPLLTRLHVLAQRQPPRPPRLHHAVGVGVAAALRLALGNDEHVRAQRGEELAAQRAAVGARLVVRRRAHGVPASMMEVIAHPGRSTRADQALDGASRHDGRRGR